MLIEILQGAESGGVVVLLDSANYSGRHLIKSFVNAALKREEIVHVLGFEVSEEEFKGGLDTGSIQRLHYHNAYSDPLGWTEHPSFTIHHFTSELLTDLFRQTQQSRPVTLVIDSLSWILRHLSTPVVCKRLQDLKKGEAVRTVVGLLHSDLHQRGSVGTICHLASSVISVAPGPRGHGPIAKTTRRSKSGKITQDEEIFSIEADLMVSVQSKPPHSGHIQADADGHEVDPTANLTFNLRLSDTEREAKEKLALPFVFSREKKSALLHSAPGSGRILYEPDASDDFDLEDPDDDLDV